MAPHGGVHVLPVGGPVVTPGPAVTPIVGGALEPGAGEVPTSGPLMSGPPVQPARASAAMTGTGRPIVTSAIALANRK
jgi:hypothetical protein